MIRKGIVVIILTLMSGFLIIISNADENREIPSSESGAKTYTLGSISNIYEPVEFSHETHSLLTESCQNCHHNSEEGKTPSCKECHVVSSESKGSGLLDLKEAYHRLCTGCHKEMETGPTSCAGCHTKKITRVSSTNKKPRGMPEFFVLNRLEDIYQPVRFTHIMHTAFADDCAECHHHSPAGQTPSCSKCHSASFNLENLNMPGLKGAYHLQCMGCHKEMGSGPTGCIECHAKKSG
ncbi:MAG: cytochrome c family protein [candidate division Zixibacteria bacterium]|nr:cytochrome c family protein [candidate division Zixibacteria bacterium]